MIVYKYLPYDSDDEQRINTDTLMSILTEMMMQNQISLEEAIKELINRGLPVNLFLREKNMNDLVSDLEKRISEAIQKILNTYDFSTLKDLFKIEIKDFLEMNKLNPIFQNSDYYEKIQKVIDEENPDSLLRLKWEDSFGNYPVLSDIIDELISKYQANEYLVAKSSKFDFRGKIVPDKKEAWDILKDLDQLTELLKAIREMIETGDIFNINLENIAKYLGLESYNEFVEKRNAIFEQLKNVLSKEGKIIEDENGKISLSPKSIQKIGKKVLTEIFSGLKSDETGHRATDTFGESENEISLTKKYEFGDSVVRIDYTGSIINSTISRREAKMSLTDLDVFYSRGYSKSATVILLDMSGSMERSNRFYNAKKVTLALDSLLREEYNEDKLTVIGFGSIAKIIPIAELAFMQPYPVTIYNPHIKLKFDFSKLSGSEIDARVPMYFTNLQKGLSLARSTLSSKQTNNKNIILITDGAPTAHFKGPVLHLNYPPTPVDFEESLNEVKRCVSDKITINTFLLTSDWDFSYFGEESFIKQFTKIAKGRIFYSNPNELNKMILFDFIKNKKKILEYS